MRLLSEKLSQPASPAINQWINRTDQLFSYSIENWSNSTIRYQHKLTDYRPFLTCDWWRIEPRKAVTNRLNQISRLIHEKRRLIESRQAAQASRVIIIGTLISNLLVRVRVYAHWEASYLSAKQRSKLIWWCIYLRHYKAACCTVQLLAWIHKTERNSNGSSDSDIKV